MGVGYNESHRETKERAKLALGGGGVEEERRVIYGPRLRLPENTGCCCRSPLCGSSVSSALLLLLLLLTCSALLCFALLCSALLCFCSDRRCDPPAQSWGCTCWHSSTREARLVMLRLVCWLEGWRAGCATQE
jgi:hypothetical protein